MNTILLAVTGPIAAIGAWLALRNRIALSRAKHRSLSGHARLSQRLAKLLPFYEYRRITDLRSGPRAGRRGGAPPDRVRAAGASSVRWVASHGPGHRRARIGPVGSPVRQRLSRSVSVLAVRAQASEGRRASRGSHRGSSSAISTAARRTISPAPTARMCSGTTSTRNASTPASSASAIWVRCSARITRWSPTTSGNCRTSPAWMKCRSTCPAPKR